MTRASLRGSSHPAAAAQPPRLSPHEIAFFVREGYLVRLRARMQYAAATCSHSYRGVQNNHTKPVNGESRL
jgi:hypothetical protein